MCSPTVPKHVRRRRRLEAAGLCFWCGKNKSDRGQRKRCSSCLIKNRSHPSAKAGGSNKTRQNRIDAGLCMYCGKLPATEGKRCLPCKEKDNASHKEWMKKTTEDRLSKGLCKDCGKNPVASTMYCTTCLDRRLKYVNNASPDRRKKTNELARKWRHRTRLIVIDRYTNGKRQCSCCGENELMFLAIDHVDNDGYEHRKTVAQGNLPRWLIRNNFPTGFQILCSNCNMGKRLNGGICPHKTNKVDHDLQAEPQIINGTDSSNGILNIGQPEEAQDSKSEYLAQAG